MTSGTCDGTDRTGHLQRPGARRSRERCRRLLDGVGLTLAGLALWSQWSTVPPPPWGGHWRGARHACGRREDWLAVLVNEACAGAVPRCGSALAMVAGHHHRDGQPEPTNVKLVAVELLNSSAPRSRLAGVHGARAASPAREEAGGGQVVGRRLPPPVPVGALVLHVPPSSLTSRRWRIRAVVATVMIVSVPERRGRRRPGCASRGSCGAGC